MSTTTTTAPAIALDVRICETNHGYIARFFGERAEDNALAFIDRKKASCAISEVYDEDDPMKDAIDARYIRLLHLLYPQCEHGLSAHLCAGPGHYPTDL